MGTPRILNLFIMEFFLMRITQLIEIINIIYNIQKLSLNIDTLVYSLYKGSILITKILQRKIIFKDFLVILYVVCSNQVQILVHTYLL
jgi:hypothetical protein